MRFPGRLGILATLFALIAVALAACGGGSSSDSGKPAATATSAPLSAGASIYNGVGISPDVPRPNLVLTDTSGQPYDLKQQTAGQLTLIYVGYTHCPDICPTIMADVNAALKQLPADQSAKIKVVFITSDPERDTPTLLRKWLDSFNTSFIGLVPTTAQLDAVAQALLMPPITKEDTGTANYGVSHAAYVMAFTQDNFAHLVYPDGMTVQDWVHDLPMLVKDGYKKPTS